MTAIVPKQILTSSPAPASTRDTRSTSSPATEASAPAPTEPVVDVGSSSFEDAQPTHCAPVDLSGDRGSMSLSVDLSVTFRVSFCGGLVPSSHKPAVDAPPTKSVDSASPKAVEAPAAKSVDSATSRREVFLFGNKKRSRTLGEYIKRAQKRGLPIDASKFSKEDLKKKVPSGKAMAVTADGQVLGLKSTSDLMANTELGVAGHLQKPGVGDNQNTVSRKGSETIGKGGTVELDGETFDVKNTLLRSPVSLDLNGDGRIGTTGRSTAQVRRDGAVGRTVAFDVDGDGRKEQTEWMAGDGDALLVDDRDGGATRAVGTARGIDGRRLFGDQGGRYANGYEKLAQLDANHDGSLDGDELDGVKAWIDDGDGKLEEGELKSLAELGVSQVSTQMNRVQNERGESLMRSSFVRDGQRQMSEDVWFASRG